MAETSLLWQTNNTGDGTGTGYTADQMFQLFRSFCPVANKGGVCPDVLNELAVTGTSSPVAVNTGQALVYGIPYFNSASVNVVIATPASLTRIDRIVLRASWAAQTVRITRIAGTEGGAAPAMTQTPSTTWDIPLATVSITTGGVITVTDAREWVGGVGDLSIVAGKLAPWSVDPRSNISGQNGIVVDPQNGDARGTDAVDLQTIRTTSVQVASGQEATVGGGKNNKASGTNSTVDGGIGNIASGTDAAVGGGTGNTASQTDSVVGGGKNNTASGVGATASGGETNTASGDDAVVGGGSGNSATGNSDTVSGGSSNQATAGGGAVGGGSGNVVSVSYGAIPGGFFNAVSGGYGIAMGINAKADKFGQMAHSAGQFAAAGDAQSSRFVLRGSTANNTPTELFINGSSVRLTIASDTTWAFRIIVVARRSDADNESAIYEFFGGIDNNAGTTALVGSVVATTPIEDTAAWAVAVTADNTNDALVITVTGENSKTIKWVASVWTTEVTA